MLAALLRLTDGYHRHGRTDDISKAAPGGAKKRQLIFLTTSGMANFPLYVEECIRSTSVKARIANTEGKTPTELLAAVRPANDTTGVRVWPLKSGDIEVMVPDQLQKAKDHALNQQEMEGCKILRQDYSSGDPGGSRPKRYKLQ
jgi:hypothetical protein